MDNIFQNNVWVSEVGEVLHKYSSATVNFVIQTIGITSDVIKPSDDWLTDVNDFFKQFTGLDYFQWQLLKIFLSVLMTLVFMIFCAWWVYGARITERFMEPGDYTFFFKQIFFFYLVDFRKFHQTFFFSFSGPKNEDRNTFKYYSPHF